MSPGFSVRPSTSAPHLFTQHKAGRPLILSEQGRALLWRQKGHALTARMERMERGERPGKARNRPGPP